MSGLHVSLLGSPRIEVAGKTFSTDRRKAVALLAFLAVSRQTHSRETLATLLWPDSDQSRALANLRRTIWELNNGIGEEWLESERESVTLRRDGEVWLDVAEFEKLAQSGALRDLQSAAELYRDDFLAGFTLPDSPPFDEWQTAQVQSLRQSLTVTLARLSEGHAVQGDYEAAIAAARRWLALDQLDEAAHRQLMKLFAAQGWRSAAVRQYEQCVRVLEEELGVEPAPETEALYQQILHGEVGSGGRLDKTLEQEPATAREEKRQLQVNLPVHPTPFVGRGPELEALGRLLANPGCRLLTLLGPGGSGKTRLAIESAARRAENADLDATFVPLAPLDGPEFIVPATARSLRFSFYQEEDRDPRRQLLDYLRQQQHLLIMDNFEHLIAPESLDLMLAILQTAPGVQLLVTSRSRLNVPGEQLYPVAGMRTPEVAEALHWADGADEAQAFSAVQLFLERARRVRPGFELSRSNLAQVVEICRLVQGMPLGIELAASWLELLSPDEIAAEIARSLDFLETDQEGVPERQRSLRAVFNTSWELLAQAERDAFKRLTVLRGDFTREAAEAVSGASLRTLLALSNKSWLQRVDDQRYRVHELLRQYAEERLRANPAAWEEARQRHANHYCAWLTEQAGGLQGSGQVAAINEILREFENVRAAWQWLVDEKRFEQLIDGMLTPLILWAFYRQAWDGIWPLLQSAVAIMPEEGVDMRRRLIFSIAHVISLDETTWWTAARDRAREVWEQVAGLQSAELIQLGLYFPFLASYFGHIVDAEWAARALRDFIAEVRKLDDPWTLGWCLYVLGGIESHRRRNVEAMEALKEAEALCIRNGQLMDLVGVLHEMAAIARTTGDYERAMSLLTRAKAMIVDTDNQGAKAVLVYTLAEVALQLGNIEEALVYYQEQQELYMSIGNRVRAFNSLHWRSLLAYRFGAWEDAWRLRQEHLRLTHEAGFTHEHAWGLWETGELARIAGDSGMALQYYGESYAVFQEMRSNLGLAFYHRGLGDLALARGDFDEAIEHFEHYRQTAQAEHFSWSTAYALTGLAKAAAGKGDYDLAGQYLSQALVRAQDEGTQDLYMLILEAQAELYLRAGNLRRAVEMAAFVRDFRLTWKYVRDQAIAVLSQAEALLPAEAFVTAEWRARKLQLATLLAELTASDQSSQSGNTS